MGGAFSEPRAILPGVSQGSVLGQLLFLVYTSDMMVGLENYLIGYAHDHTLEAVVMALNSGPLLPKFEQ